MAKDNRQKPDEKLAPKINLNALTLFKKALYFTGLPFYKLFSLAFLLIVFILYTTGHFARIVLVKLVKTFLISIQSIGNLPIIFLRLSTKKVRKIKLKIPSQKPKLPSFVLLLVPLTKFRILIKLLTLKVRVLSLYFPSKKFRLPKLKPRQQFLLVTLFLVILLPTIFFIYILHGLPSPKDLKNRNIEVSTKIYDRTGVLLYNIYKDKNRTIIPLQKVPLHVRLATIAFEDAEFYSHPGFSLRGIIRSFIKNIKSGQLSGGSTITQQLVKNALLTPEKTLARKIREIILSVGTELTYSKDEILEMYLNEVSYGGTAYGIQEASQTYFGKDVDKLSLAEAALLAGLPKSPTKYSPFGTSPDLAFVRQKEVLHLMQINGFITKEQEENAAVQTLTFEAKRNDIKAPHFVMYIRSQLEDLYGKEVVETGGLKVITTLDYQIQKLAEKVVKDEVEKLKGLNVTNGAAVVLNPKTGEILAMVGSYDYFDVAHDGNVNVTTSPRQPGSSIKVVNYAYALSHGFTPASILSDTPIAYAVPGQPLYAPKNYDGTFKGNLTLRDAFAQSRNVPAVKVLASYGVGKMIEQGKKMGITTWNDTTRFGLSLTLGGGEVKLIELAQVYSTIANYGKKPEIKSLIKVSNYQDKQLYKNTCIDTQNTQNVAQAAEAKSCSEEEAVDPRVSYIITNILKDNAARTPAFGSTSALVVPNHKEVAVKTGTSNNLRDNLTVGYNQQYLVAVWVGNNDNSPMARVASGVTGASPIWNKIISALLANEPSVEWEVPKGLASLPICTLTGTLTCNGCPTRNEFFLDENKPSQVCSSEFVKNLTEVRPQPQILEPAARTSI